MDSGGMPAARKEVVLGQPVSLLTRGKFKNFDICGRRPSPLLPQCGPLGKPPHFQTSNDSSDGQSHPMSCTTGRVGVSGKEPRHRKDCGRRRRRMRTGAQSRLMPCSTGRVGAWSKEPRHRKDCGRRRRSMRAGGRPYLYFRIKPIPDSCRPSTPVRGGRHSPHSTLQTVPLCRLRIQSTLVSSVHRSGVCLRTNSVLAFGGPLTCPGDNSELNSSASTSRQVRVTKAVSQDQVKE